MKRIVLAAMLLVIPVQVQASITLSTAILVASVVASLSNLGKSLLWAKKGAHIEQESASNSGGSAKETDKPIEMDPLEGSVKEETLLTIIAGSVSEAVGKGIQPSFENEVAKKQN